MFSGRIEETESIKQSLLQAKLGNPRHFLVEGERGIGKSSLMLIANAFAHDKVDGRGELNFLPLEIELNEGTTYVELVRMVAAALQQKMSEQDHLKTKAKIAWEFLSKWNILGVEYKGEQKEPIPSALVDDLANTIAGFMADVGSQLDGLLLLIDEADKADPATANLGEFVKLLTEKLTKRGCDRLCIGLAGLPVLVQKLRQGHESSLRIFDILMLEPLSDDEVESAIQRGLDEANEKNDKPTTIDADAMKMIVHLSEGYPHFVQQFAYCAFDKDINYKIEIDDVVRGAYQENGALDQLARKYFQEMFYEKISSEDYRKVLVGMATKLDQWQSRQDIIKVSGVADSQVTNALAALKKKNIILANEEKKGEYRLPTKSFAVWLRAIDARKKRKTKEALHGAKPATDPS